VKWLRRFLANFCHEIGCENDQTYIFRFVRYLSTFFYTYLPVNIHFQLIIITNVSILTDPAILSLWYSRFEVTSFLIFADHRATNFTLSKTFETAQWNGCAAFWQIFVMKSGARTIKHTYFVFHYIHVFNNINKIKRNKASLPFLSLGVEIVGYFQFYFYTNKPGWYICNAYLIYELFFNYFVFNRFTWWRVFQKRVVQTQGLVTIQINILSMFIHIDW
jgi:hypothetical protein